MFPSSPPPSSASFNVHEQRAKKQSATFFVAVGGEREMGEKDAEEKKKGGGEGEKKKDGDGGGGKKEEAQSPLEMKLDMHCEGCAQKVRRAVIKGFKDAEKVTVDAANNKLKVVGGKVDPWALKEFLENKTGKKVEFISPKDPPKKKPDDPPGDAKKAGDAKDQKKSDGDKKPKAPSESTVQLKIRLHCDACIKRIQKEAYKVKGVKEVTLDAAKDLVTVKGTMDAKSLVDSLKKRLSRSVEVVDSKPKGDGGEKKKAGGDEKKDKGGEKKEGAGGDDKKDDGEKSAAAAAPPSAALPVPVAEMNRMDYYGGYGYRVEMVHAPQLFSDENPNACAIM